MSVQEELGFQSPIGDLRHETVLNIVRTGSLLSTMAGRVFRAHDLTEAQFNVLFALAFGDGDITQAELSKRLVVTRASITSVLDKLEAKGLVSREQVAANRRIHHVRLTATGEALIEQVEGFYRAAVCRALDDLSDAECKALIALLERTRDRAKAGLERPQAATQ